jgi:hypothetical protein
MFGGKLRLLTSSGVMECKNSGAYREQLTGAPLAYSVGRARQEAQEGARAAWRGN